MIIVIRGTNGSGKSHAVRAILSRGEKVADLAEGSTLIRVPRVKRPVLVIGPYTDGRSMGGCDCIRQPSRIYEQIVEAITEEWHVLLEGVVLATKPYLDYYRDGHDVRYALLNPPLATCLENIRARQKRKGHTSTLSHDAMKGKRRRALMMYDEARKIGMPAIKFTDAPIDATPWILEQLRSA